MSQAAPSPNATLPLDQDPAATRAPSSPEPGGGMHGGEMRVERTMMWCVMGGTLALVGWLYGLRAGGDSLPADLVTAVGAFMLAIPMFAAAITEVRTLRFSASTLAALAILAAFAIEQFAIAALIGFVLIVADLFLRRSALGAEKALRDLVALTPKVARRVSPQGSESEVQVAELAVGDVVRVRPGENLPADGEIIAGRSTINQASLTGESMPVEGQVGTAVYAGTTNLTGQVDIRVTSTGDDTTIGKVKQLISAAQEDQTPRQQLIQRVAAFYVPIAVAVAGTVFFLLAKGNETEVERAALTAVTVLVVMCPTSLLLASPTAMMAAFASAARLGIMIKRSEYLEAAAGVDAVVMDKTGTLTTGNFGVSRLAPAEGVDGAALLQAAVDAEQHSNHPLAQSILRTAQQARISPEVNDEYEELHGRGVRARTTKGVVLAGRSSWIREMSVGQESEIEGVEKKIEGMSGVHVVLDGKYLGAVGLEDKVRAQSVAMVQRLRELGVRVIAIFTGDRLSVAKRVGVTVGADAIEAECLPEEKHEQVRVLKEQGYRVMMVGDGINDGPALAEADVGVAMGLTGTDIAANSAGVALMTDELNRLPFLIELSRRTRAVITQNLVIAMVMATVGLVLAASGQFARFAELGLFAALLFNFGPDLTVVANSFRLFRFGEDFLATEHAAQHAGEGPQRRTASVRNLSPA